METTELYSREELDRLKRKYRLGKRAAALIASAALLCCALLCCLTNTANAGRMEQWVIGISTLAGCVVIYLLSYTVAAVRHELTHAEMLRSGERRMIEGVLDMSGAPVRIRGSIRFYPLKLTEGEQCARAKIIDARADALRPAAGRRIRLYLVNGYAAAFEEL